MQSELKFYNAFPLLMAPYKRHIRPSRAIAMHSLLFHGAFLNLYNLKTKQKTIMNNKHKNSCMLLTPNVMYIVQSANLREKTSK